MILLKEKNMIEVLSYEDNNLKLKLNAPHIIKDLKFLNYVLERSFNSLIEYYKVIAFQLSDIEHEFINSSTIDIPTLSLIGKIKQIILNTNIQNEIITLDYNLKSNTILNVNDFNKQDNIDVVCSENELCNVKNDGNLRLYFAKSKGYSTKEENYNQWHEKIGDSGVIFISTNFSSILISKTELCETFREKPYYLVSIQTNSVKTVINSLYNVFNDLTSFFSSLRDYLSLNLFQLDFISYDDIKKLENHQIFHCNDLLKKIKIYEKQELEVLLSRDDELLLKSQELDIDLNVLKQILNFILKNIND